MAHIHPSLPLPRVAQSLGLATELQVLERLRQALPDAFTLFHSVDWMSPMDRGVARGEIDIAVVNQAGDLALIEVKGGEVDFTEQGIFKTYRNGTVRNVGQQISMQYRYMRKRLAEQGIEVQVQQLLVLPHMHVQTATAHWPRERIVDAQDFEDLPHHIHRLLGVGEPQPAQEAVLQFLANEFKVQVDVASVLQRLGHTTSRLSSGLATWVPRITSPQGIYRVQGTAGSGKTQLALQVLREAAQKGLRAAYCCFNSPLAAVIAQRVPATVEVQTFHHMARRICEGQGHTVDFALPDVFERIGAQAVQRLTREDATADLDLLVLDEMQDLKADWVQALLHRLRPNGRAYLLEDSDQLLYEDREPFDVQGEVVVRCHDNARSPRELIALVNALRLTPTPITGLNPYQGTVAQPREYANPEQLVQATTAAVQAFVGMGFGLDQIAVLTLRGRASSQILQLDGLGPWTLRKASAQRTEDGDETWTQGELLCETVHRFKGQAVAAVVLTEVDVDAEQPMHWQRLYVGITRAQAALQWVVSERGARALEARLTG